MRWGSVLLLVAALLVGACGGGESATPQGPGEFSMPELEPCPKAGDVFTESIAKDGCREPDGGILIPGVWECDDGRYLLGDDSLWAWIDEPVTEVAGDVAEDDAYREAYEECIGG